MTDKSFLQVDNLHHRYGDRVAVENLSFFVNPGEIFGLLGPNGSGKTTLFRILSTLLPLQDGSVRIGRSNLVSDLSGIRRQLGVVFQSPSLDKKLTVRENMVHQGHLYGLHGASLHSRIDHLLEQLSLEDRRGDRVETLSGGLARRVEVAKGLLHNPPLLLLDEPTTGLDPAARIELWNYLQQINAREGTTILVTTHLMDEADRCHRMMILNKGQRVCLDTPGNLRSAIGGQVITIECKDPEKLLATLSGHAKSKIIGSSLRLEASNADSVTKITRQVQELLNSEVSSYTVSLPTLEDVFIHYTGQKFEVKPPAQPKKKK